MQCPNCQTANADEARFCSNCGQALVVRCPNCGAEAAAGAKFCSTCGHALAGPPPPAADPLRRFIPREFAARLEAARTSHAMEGDRRIVTILFCDVKGSTAMAEKLDPEEWAEIMNGAFEHLITPVYRYEGTVARLMGDAILAFFGAPIAHEDDPQRAVLAGLGIVEAVRDYREQMQRQYGLDFNVRVGINTGLVVVGAVGSDLRLEYTAMGDAVNLAARMEQTAPAGAVQISGNTHRLIAPLFDFEDLGGVEVKGKAEPVPAFRVLRPKAQPGRLRGIEGLDSALVGRDREMRALREAVAEVQQGRGQIVSIMGEAGLGKSRLVAELRRAHSPGGDNPAHLRWLEGRSLSFQTATPYAPFAGLLNAYFELPREGSDDERYADLQAKVAEVMPERADEVAPFLAVVLDVKLSGEPADRVRFLEPPQVRGKVFGAVAEFVERLAAPGPLALAFDDVHWMDPTSLELVEGLLGLTERAALLIVLILRPQRQEPAWRLHTVADQSYGHRYVHLALKPLEAADSRQLVANLLHVEDLPEKVRALILAKAEGNPFFVEEVIRSLLDAQLVVRVNSHWRATREIENIALPDTIAGVITARLDRLSEPSRRAAQSAAVIGREFGLNTLADVHDSPDDLTDALADLQRRELVREKSRIPEPVFIFKHVLTQETAYSSILLRQRRELHRRVADSLIRAAADRPYDIGRHLLEAREQQQALPYLLDAADRAARAYSTQEAIGLYRQALQVLEAVDDLGAARRAYEGLGSAFNLTNQIPQAVETYQAMLDLATARGDKLMQTSALNKMAFVYALRMGQFQKSDEYLREAERLAQEGADKPGLSELYMIRCQMCTATADFEGVLHYMGASVALGRELNIKEQMAQGLEHIANTLNFMTQYDKAWQTAQEALAISREIGDRLHEASVLAMVAPLYHLRNGDLEAARGAAEEGVSIAGQIGAIHPAIYGNWSLGEVARLRGEYETALHRHGLSLQASLPLEEFMPFMTVQPLGALGSTYIEISRALADRARQHHDHALRLLDHPAGTFGGGTAWADVGYCLLSVGNVAAAQEVFQKGLNTPTMYMLLEKPRFLVGAALVALRQGQLDQAAAHVAEARAYAEERQMKHVYPLIAFAEGQVSAARDDPERALAAFEQAEALAAEMGMRPMTWQAQAGAARALDRLERPDQAATKRQTARLMVAEIAALFEDADLRRLYVENAESDLAGSGG